MKLKKHRLFQYLWFAAGIALNAVGVAIITKASLGTSPITSVVYVLSLRFAPSLGTFTIGMNLILVALQALLLRKNFPPFQLLQIVVSILFGLLIDLCMKLFAWLNPVSIVSRAAALLIGCAVLAFGIAIELAANVLTVPGEGMVKVIATVTGAQTGIVKTLFDCTLVAIAAVCSLIFFRAIRGLGVGTVVSAVLVGQLVNLYNRHIGLISSIKALSEPKAA